MIIGNVHKIKILEMIKEYNKSKDIALKCEILMNSFEFIFHILIDNRSEIRDSETKTHCHD